MSTEGRAPMAMVGENPFLPRVARILDIREETPDTKTFVVSVEGGEDFSYQPGQFVQLSVFGAGEAPFGFASWPGERGKFELTVRRLGRVTTALHNLPKGSFIGIRGPLGRPFPVEEFQGKDVLIVAGGLGLAPLRTVIHYILKNRERYGKLTVLYGARTPKDLLYKPDLFEDWERREDLRLLVTVDVGDEEWRSKGRREGVVTTLYEEIKGDVDVERTVALVCGPPVMFRFAVRGLLDMGFKPSQIWTTLERQMMCGIGKCNHCCIGEKYVCVDGPVFSYEEIQGFSEEAF